MDPLRGLRSRRLLAILAFVALMGLATACDVLDPPSRRMELSGTAWRVVQAGQQQLDSRVELIFVNDFDFEVRSSCGVLAGTYGVDSDGSLLEFFGFEGSPMSCDDDEAAERDLVAEALRTNDRWEIADQDAIRLDGTEVLELERAAASR